MSRPPPRPQSRAPLVSALLALLALLPGPAAADADSGGGCIDERQVDYTRAPDPGTLDFVMKDGTVWRNRLQAPCPGLVNNPQGWSYAPTQPETGRICANEQAIRLTFNGSFCHLGAFTHLPRGAK
jgi:hypothetical protein